LLLAELRVYDWGTPDPATVEVTLEVPLEPTEAMMDAADKALYGRMCETVDQRRALLKEAWTTMLDEWVKSR
jgi:hypothetical protein